MNVTLVFFEMIKGEIRHTYSPCTRIKISNNPKWMKNWEKDGA